MTPSLVDVGLHWSLKWCPVSAGKKEISYTLEVLFLPEISIWEWDVSSLAHWEEDYGKHWRLSFYSWQELQSVRDFTQFIN